MPVRRKRIRDLVEKLLRESKVSAAPIPIELIAKAVGLQISRQDAEDDLSGFLVRDPKNSRVVVGVNSKHHENRQRFTIAHEVGHFLLHSGDVVHVDRSERAFQVNLRDQESSKGTNDDEKEANLFAAELLMPSSFLDRDLTKLQRRDILNDDALGDLAKKYQVSLSALTFRLSYLGYIEQ